MLVWSCKNCLRLFSLTPEISWSNVLPHRSQERVWPGFPLLWHGMQLLQYFYCNYRLMDNHFDLRLPLKTRTKLIS